MEQGSKWSNGVLEERCSGVVEKGWGVPHPQSCLENSAHLFSFLTQRTISAFLSIVLVLVVVLRSRLGIVAVYQNDEWSKQRGVRSSPKNEDEGRTRMMRGPQYCSGPGLNGLDYR